MNTFHRKRNENELYISIMEMNELRYFIAVSETQNIHRASENINISTGSLSKAISRLEAELGVKLFNRVGRGIRLTQEGKFLKKRASHILNMEIDTKLSILGQEASFKAVIAGNETLLSYYGLDIAQKVTSLYPQSLTELIPINDNALLSKLDNGEVNLGLSTQAPNSDFDFKKISEVKFYTVAGKGHPLFKFAKSNTEVPVSDVLRYSFVVPSNNVLGRTNPGQSNDGWRDDKFLRKKSFITSSLKTLESFVNNGSALAYLPDYMIVNSALEILNIPDCPYQCKQKVYLISRNKSEMSWINQVF